MSTETIYAELDTDGQTIKTDGTTINVKQDNGTTTVEVKDGTPGDSNDNDGNGDGEGFEIAEDKLDAAKIEAEAVEGYSDLDTAAKKQDAIIDKYIAAVSDATSKNHPKTEEDKTKIREKLGEQLGGKAKKARKSAKKGKKSKGKKGKRAKKSAKKGKK